MRCEAGCAARSLAGHDKDTYYIILSDEGRLVTVADGKTRTVLAPKRKNKRHIQADRTPLLDAAALTDETIRSALAGLERDRLSNGKP